MKSNVQFKKIKGGIIAKFIRKKKLRDDIPCSLVECQLCECENPLLNMNQPIILLDYNIIYEQIDAIENFDVINNCIIPQSEYLMINQRNQNLFKRFNLVLEKRNIYIFANEFHSEITIADEYNIKKDLKQIQIFSKTAEYLFKHFQNISNDFKFLILTNSTNKAKYTALLADIINEASQVNSFSDYIFLFLLIVLY